MEEQLKELYIQEIEAARLDFDSDPLFQKYYTQAQAIWEGKDMPDAIFRLLDTSNLKAFAHGYRLGVRMGRWLREG